MDQKPPPYAPPYSAQPYPTAPYPGNPMNPGNAPYNYQNNPPYPVAHPGFPQPQPMIQQPQQYHVPPQQQQPVPQHTTTAVIVQGPPAGTCPICRSGRVEKEFTCCGICCGIVFFPIGLLCCFCMRENKCSVCRANF